MKELRIGLVLYGGVSLAIYMNGISTELWQLLRASKARHGGQAKQLDGTAKIYADLLDELQHLTKNDLRVVVDAVAGTSAGGINGAVLAKAIVDGGDASILNKVWLDDADISRLRAEPPKRLPWYWRAPLCIAECALESVRNLKARVIVIPNVSWRWLRDHFYSLISQKDGQSTPLDGDYFTRMIASTLKKMGSGPPLLPNSESFDLYLTQTDLHGWPRHLPVSRDFHGDPLYERTHAHVTHIRRRPNGGAIDDDFALTYAARSSASFPVAFAPINYDSIKTSYQEVRPKDPVKAADQFVDDRLPEHALFDYSANAVWMIDGGVLDNKPFTHVTRAIERKPARHQVSRVLAYVEPDPEDSLEPPTDQTTPKSLQVVRDLYKLFRHEPIYEDLRRLYDRNEKVADIRRLIDANSDNARRAVDAAGRSASLSIPPDPARADDWRKATNDYAAKADMSGYPGYVVLKARSAGKVLAGLVCNSLGYPYDSRHAYFIRKLVSRQLEQRDALTTPTFDPTKGYELQKEQRRLLSAFDIPFRLRRLRAMVRAMDELYLALEHGDRPPKGSEDSYDPSDVDRNALDVFKSELETAALAFEELLEDTSRFGQIVRETLGVQDVRSAIHDTITANDFTVEPFIRAHAEHIEHLYNRLAQELRVINDQQDNRVIEALANLPMHDPSDGYRRILDAFVTFPFVDIVAYPLAQTADIVDLIPIKVMRISPRDVTRTSHPPLASRDLGGFQGFLKRSARQHDMKWGRRDGTERLVAMIMDASQAEQHAPQKVARLRKTYSARLHAAI